MAEWFRAKRSQSDMKRTRLVPGPGRAWPRPGVMRALGLPMAAARHEGPHTRSQVIAAPHNGQ